MLKKLISFGIFILVLTAQTAQAALSLSVEDVPSSINADIYTFTVNTVKGAKVTVTGGVNEVPPVTDTDNDGVVEISVGLVQNSQNTFSFRAEKDGDSSDTKQVVLQENSGSTDTSNGDTTAPAKPILDSYSSEIDAETITLTGVAEANSVVTAAKTDGTKLTSVSVKEDGAFSLKITLEQNKRNRINLTAKDSAGNTSTAVQVVIVELNETSASTEEATETSVTAEDFSDTQNHWAKEYIRALKIAGIISGKSAEIFAPDDYLTRAELTKIALNAFDISVQNNITNRFDDVKSNDWFAAYVNTAKNEGIVSGYSDGFRPNQNITRAEALKILLTAGQFDIPEESPDFSDVSSDAWYKKYVAFAEKNGIVGGYNDGTFRPNQFITRAEIAKITVKAMEIYSTLLAEKEEEKTENEDTEENTDEFVNDNRVYTNTTYKFSLQYYKNWYYETMTGSGDTIIQTGFAGVEDAVANAEAILELKTGSLESIAKTNLSTETNGEEIRYFVEYSDTKHIEIYGDSAIQERLETMAKTVEVE